MEGVLFDFLAEALIDDKEAFLFGVILIESGVVVPILSDDVSAFGEDLVAVAASDLFGLGISPLLEVVRLLLLALPEHENYIKTISLSYKSRQLSPAPVRESPPAQF